MPVVKISGVHPRVDPPGAGECGVDGGSASDLLQGAICSFDQPIVFGRSGSGKGLGDPMGGEKRRKSRAGELATTV